MKQYLNIGCGFRFHSSWTNIDLIPSSEAVMAYNLHQGLPFSDESFDVVYHSHVLEHFPKNKAEWFLKESYRVLRPNGVMRIAVPDLESIARLYLQALENAISGSQEWADHYNWILLEMYDQTVRNYSGGEMATYLCRQNIPNQDFILKRCGLEAKKLIEIGKLSRQKSRTALESQPKRLLKQIYRFFRYPTYRRELLLEVLLGQEYNALQVGRFRQSGEVHQWMYDRYSLAKLLKQCGLEQIVQRTATESYIPNWSSFNLDTEPDGTVYKPDSLFMEAIKPAV